jgi:excisionase family DNA binding protein
MVVARTSDSPEHGAPALAAEGRGYYGISEAAALLGVSRVTIWRRIRDGQLLVLRLGHRTARIKRADLEQLLVQIHSGESRAWNAKERGDAAAQHGNGHDRAPRADLTEMGPSDHVAQLYEADTFLADTVADYLAAGLRAGDTALVIATPAHREQIEERLRAGGEDVDAARDSGRYVALDAAETLASFLVDGEPDVERFREVVGGVVARAAADGRPVRAFGEMVGLLAAAGKDAAAIRLEGLWNELGRAHVFSLVCGYPLAKLGAVAPSQLVDDVAASHTRIVPAE